ncbi:hypothetical protein [Methyloterricola oryzae]|uniref:hypothetical protein n=1 Tax=Methyloterricola oryzae TaxID=1495050 RepID=UPI000BF0F91E|nr:hypothetical protein [Methyloterricola oryzae]
MNHVRMFTQICALLATLAVTPAWAWGGHGGGGHWGGAHWGGAHWGHGYGYGYGGYYGRPSVGFYFGAGLGWPAYPYYPYPVYPSTVITVPAAPPIYIQQSVSPQSSRPVSNFWYYCRSPNAYYPYVEECPGGWQPVAPEPSDR